MPGRPQALPCAPCSLGYKSAPPTNHTTGWRDRRAGFHSNDTESELSRLKKKIRERYGQLSFQANVGEEPEAAEDVDTGDLYKYCFYINNVGSSFETMLEALVTSTPAYIVCVGPAKANFQHQVNF